MFALSYGTAMQGEVFVHPIVATLRKSLMRECPALVPKRFEIRLILEASGKFSLLEVPADAVSTVKAEDNRQSLLRLIERAETEWMVPEKLAGKWGATPAAHTFQSRGPSRASANWPISPIAML